MATKTDARNRAPIVDTNDSEQTARGNELIVRMLEEALATENTLVSNLSAHISMTPRGAYRKLLERHLAETQQQAKNIGQRLQELGAGKSIIAQATGVVETLIGNAIVLTKGPIDLIRGQAGEEKLLKNAKDECATEALEIATYDAIERVAQDLGDTKTADLARRHRAQEERMLSDLRDQIALLSDKVTLALVSDVKSFDPTTTGAADALRRVRDEVAERWDDAVDEAEDAVDDARDTVKKGASKARAKAEETGTKARAKAQETGTKARAKAEDTGTKARAKAEQTGDKARAKADEAGDKAKKTARSVPGEQQAEGTVRGAAASESDLPIKDYDSLTAGEVVSKLPELSQLDLAKVGAYESKNRDRSTVLDRIESLQGDEPFAGYDELTAKEVVERVRKGDTEQATKVREYEQRHKRRVDVLAATQREISNAS